MDQEKDQDSQPGPAAAPEESIPKETVEETSAIEIDFDEPLNLSILSREDAAEFSPAAPLPASSTAGTFDDDKPSRGRVMSMIFLTAIASLLVLLLVTVVLWRFSQDQMQANFDQMAATMAAQATQTEAEVATRLAAAIAIATAETDPDPASAVSSSATPPPATNTPTPPPEESAAFNPVEELAAVELTATPVPVRITATPAPQEPAATPAAVTDPSPPPAGLTLIANREIFFQEDFSSNGKGWAVGLMPHPHARNIIEFSQGKYRQTVAAAQTMLLQQPYPNFTVKDFILTVETTLLEAGGQAGVVISFRQDRAGNYYLARFSNNGQYELGLIYEGEQHSLQPPTASRAFNLATGETNHFTVMAQGSTLSVYANGQRLTAVDDSTLGHAGQVGLGVHVGEPNQRLIAEFDNLVVAEAP